MSLWKSRLRLICAFAALAALVLAASCRGFFVKPTLSSLAIGPTTVSLTPNQTFQMTATGTFSDGSQENVTSKSVWSTSDASVASVGQTSGVVTAASSPTNIGTTTISASDGSVTATTTATVTVCPVVSNLNIAANPTNGASTTTTNLSATATVGGTAGTDVSTIVTWNVSNPSALTISNDVGTFGTSGQSTTLTATLCNVQSVNTLTLTVN